MNNIVMMTLRALARKMSSGIFVGTALLIVLSMLIWFQGQHFRYLDYKPFASAVNRLIAIGVLIILWGINNFIIARRAARTKPKQVVEEEVKPRDPVEEEVALLRQSFRNVMTTIKSKWAGKESGSRSVYALPWYLVLGPSHAGKTTLVTESDLKFPLNHILNTADSSSLSRLPQYWVTSESVLFDVPGAWVGRTFHTAAQPAGETRESSKALVTAENPTEWDETPVLVRKPGGQSRERRLWSAFMDLLVEFRPRRPINGVILCVDAAELVRASDQGRVAMAAALHSLLVELAERLGTRFTVHVVITKIDRLAGFRNYFAQLSKQERAEPFGFSFPVYDEISADKWATDFESHFAAFIDKANDDMIDKLCAQRDSEARRAIYTFSRELAALGPIVADFFRRSLHSDKFSTPPLTRGIYFTSARQQGVPFDALLSRVSRDYHMKAPVLPAYSGQSIRFFVERLFQRSIFLEAGLAGDNKAVESRKRMILHGAVLGSVLALLVFGFLLNETMQDNSARAANVLGASRDFVTLPREEVLDGQEDQYLAALNAIRAANEEFPGWKDTSEARRYLALYQGRRIGPEVEKAYEDLLRQRYLPALAARVKQRIDAMGEDENQKYSDERLDALRVYLLLGDLGKRAELDASEASADLGKKAIMAWTKRDWQTRFEGNEAIQNDLARHLEYALDTKRIAAPLDAQTVESAQAALHEVPRDLRLYRSLEALAQRQVPGGMSFRTEVGPSFDIVFKQRGETQNGKADIVIPYFFTKQGFHEFFAPKNDALSVIAVEDAWVTGERANVRYSPEDLEAFRAKIRHRYATAYINTWSQAINGLEIVDFRNVDEAMRVLEEINGPANPFGRLLGLVKAQSELYEAKPVDTNAEQPQTEIKFDANREQGLRVMRAFSDLSALITAKGDQKPYFEELMARLGGLEGYMRAVKGGQDSSKPVALERAQERAKLQGDDPIFVVRRTGANLPAPFDKLLTQIATNSWKVVLQAAKTDLQAVWQDDVYRTFNVSLAPRYPFNKNAQDEVSLAEFQQFFGPEGQFESFFNQHLSTFVNEKTGKAVVIDGQSLTVSDEFLEQVKRVRHIRDVFFDAQGVPTLRYTVEPLSLSGTMSRAVLNLEGQLVPYSHGPSRPISILWPNALSSRQNISQLSVFSGGSSGTAAQTFQGLWSSFRLFETAVASDAQPDSVDLTFAVGNGKIRYRIRMATPENPFQTEPLSRLQLPETL